MPKSYEYIEKLMASETEMMQQARAYSQQLGLEAISISATEASLIGFQLQMINAKKVVEVGTLTGLSALYILRSLPSDGFLWTLEKSPEHVALAEKVLGNDIKAKRCKIILGDAQEKLKELSSLGPFDAIFIDGNKAAYLDYFNWADANIRVGGIIFVDNIFLAGAVWGDETQQKFNFKQINAVQTMNQQAFSSPQLNSVVIPTEEGLLLCRKIS
ncbi:MAG: class I SAM-dependent methyltransferase [Bdellovibrionaceae bacterium]|nr:class I SAM-dependent methyltransferase [Bdellovibrio sp.]